MVEDCLVLAPDVCLFHQVCSQKSAETKVDILFQDDKIVIAHPHLERNSKIRQLTLRQHKKYILMHVPKPNDSTILRAHAQAA